MSELAFSRTPDLIAAEINHIKEETRKHVLYNSIEIGRKLTEAKLLVNHGEWGSWLQQKVDYSKSTANNLMKIFEEYGSSQITLLGDNAKSQAIGDLSYTQAIALLGIHDVTEREEFIEHNNIDEMSTRELKKAIDELNKSKEEKEALEKELNEFKSKSNEEKEKSKEEKEKLKKAAEKSKKIAEELTLESNKLLEDLNKKDEETLEVRKELQECQSKIKELEEKPVEVITAVDEDKVKEIEKIEEEHRKEIELLKVQRDEVEGKLKDLENNNKKQNENVIKYRVHFDKLVTEFKDILEDVNNIKNADPGEAEKYANACKTLINKMLERL
jgi:DNA repair exonuclease SbcCD ATPase subunit